jgi:UDP-glucose 4-epimerase
LRILVTGGAGFIGSTAVQQLLARGHDLVVLDNLETGSRDNVPAAAHFVEGDIRDLSALLEAVRGCDALVHQAAMVSVALSVTDPTRCWEVNVTGTRHALEAARLAGVRRLVLASSAAVYGQGPALPKQEAGPIAPASPYAYSKWLNEVDAGYYSRYHGLETVCLRYFNVYGPRQRPDSPYSGVISIAARQILDDRVFTVHGTGEQTRDFVFVEDVAEAIARSVETPGLREEVMNVGTGHRLDLLHLLEVMGKAAGRTPKLTYGPPREGDVLHSQADVSTMAERLGFRAEVPLETGLSRTLAWMTVGTDVRP